MNDAYQKFQDSVLRFYDFYIEFEGNAPNHVERPLKTDTTEKFAAWKKRVLNIGIFDIRVYRPVTVDGRTKISTMADEGRILKQLIRQSTAKVKSTGRVELQAAEDKARLQKQKLKKKSQETVIAVQTQAARSIKETREALYKNAKKVPIDELSQIIEDIGESLEPAVREHLEKLINKAEKDEFPLQTLLKEMINTHIAAVLVVKSTGSA